MDEETRSFKIVSTKGSIGIAQIRTIGWFANQYSIDESIKKNIPGINNKTYTITPHSLFAGFSNPKPSIFTECLPSPVILREAEGEGAESKFQNEEWPVRRKKKSWMSPQVRFGQWGFKKMDELIPQDLVLLTEFFQKCSQLLQFPFSGLVEGFRNFKVFSRNPI